MSHIKRGKTMQFADSVPEGTPVSYHGTYTDEHGLATVLRAYDDFWGKSRDGYRYTITTQSGQKLELVRRQSFALVSLP
jgi:hypothetical protein